MSVIKPSICFSKQVISAKWRNKLLIQNINLTVYRKNACCLRLLVFLETCLVASFWHWRSLVFPKGCCYHDLKAICESGHNNLFKLVSAIFYQFFIFSPNNSSLKNYEKCFLFHLESSFRSRDI